MRFKYLILFVLLFLPLLLPLQGEAKTLILDGLIESRIRMNYQVSFDVPNKVSSLTFRFALPTEFSNKGTSQRLDGLNVKFTPEPSSVSDETDAYGNQFKRAKWKGLDKNVMIAVSYTAAIKSKLGPMESAASFPLGDIPKADAVFLKTTEMVQSDSGEIKSLSKTLSAGAKTEYEVVQAVLNWVSDNVKYTYNPPQYDALHTLKEGKGNCQNFAHISMAILRAAGIPARIVGGISLKRQWKVPVDGGYLVQDMGQGGHAWMEIYFPDLGWLSYDPQQTRQFTSTRHIKQTHGLDSRDINDSWSAAPYLPEYGENIDASFELDEQDISLLSTGSDPKSYIMSNNLIAKAAPVMVAKPEPEIKKPEPKPEPKPEIIPAIIPPVVIKPEPPAVVLKPEPEVKKPEPVKPEKTDIKPEAKPEPKPETKPEPIKPEPPVVVAKPEPEPVKPPKKKGPAEFGNMDFPALVDAYQAVGNQATRILDKETAEYATSKYIYAQAFEVGDGMLLKGVSLAMRKFGGDGTLFIDVVKDEAGKPSLTGERSLPVFLTDIKRRPGYYWIDFKFSEGAALPPGRYWIVLRHSGEAIVNWFYIPGNPYGDGDDTRSTVKGYKWEDILNYDLVFRVKGVVE